MPTYDSQRSNQGIKSIPLNRLVRQLSKVDISKLKGVTPDSIARSVTPVLSSPSVADDLQNLAASIGLQSPLGAGYSGTVGALDALMPPSGSKRTPSFAGAVASSLPLAVYTVPQTIQAISRLSAGNRLGAINSLTNPMHSLAKRFLPWTWAAGGAMPVGRAIRDSWRGEISLKDILSRAGNYSKQIGTDTLQSIPFVEKTLEKGYVPTLAQQGLTTANVALKTLIDPINTYSGARAIQEGIRREILANRAAIMRNNSIQESIAPSVQHPDSTPSELRPLQLQYEKIPASIRMQLNQSVLDQMRSLGEATSVASIHANEKATNPLFYDLTRWFGGGDPRASIAPQRQTTIKNTLNTWPEFYRTLQQVPSAQRSAVSAMTGMPMSYWDMPQVPDTLRQAF